MARKLLATPTEIWLRKCYLVNILMSNTVEFVALTLGYELRTIKAYIAGERTPHKDIETLAIRLLPVTCRDRIERYARVNPQEIMVNYSKPIKSGCFNVPKNLDFTKRITRR